MKKITVGIPAYKASTTLPTTLASILMQSIVEQVTVIIANDDPDDNNCYEYLKGLYPTLEIDILPCEKNTGPGLARQRALDACKTDWITFIDADDVFYGPYALETLMNNTAPNFAIVQSVFGEECEEGNLPLNERLRMDQNGEQIPPRVLMIDNLFHPWVFGRLYNVNFLRQADIRFSKLRAMED